MTSADRTAWIQWEASLTSLLVRVDGAWFWSQVAQAALAQLADALLVNEYSIDLEGYCADPFVIGGLW